LFVNLPEIPLENGFSWVASIICFKSNNLNMKISLFYNLIKLFFFTASLLLFNIMDGFAQSANDSTQRKNIIKLDISGNILYNNAYNISYERVLKNNQTISFTVGSQQLPTLVSLFEDDEAEATTSRKTASGYKMGVDYRFYLAKENKYKSPHGVYIGPYLSYHNYNNSWNLSIKGDAGTQSGVVDGKFQVFNAGFQAGYQFLINNRWSIDMTFIGASFSHYRARMNVEGNFDMSDAEINQALLDKIVEKFPLLGDLITDGSVDQSGKLDNWAMGVRYLVNVGYAFGGSPKKVKKPTQ
jgi:Protein of unknown function (DUF3575)